MRTEKSVLFIIPWGPHWILGDTDTAWDYDAAHPAATRTDIEYVLDKANSMLTRPLDARRHRGGLRRAASARRVERERGHDAPQPGTHGRVARSRADDDRRRQVHDLPRDGQGSRRRRHATRRPSVAHRAHSDRRCGGLLGPLEPAGSARRRGRARRRTRRASARPLRRPAGRPHRPRRRAPRARRAPSRGGRVPRRRGGLCLHARGGAPARGRARPAHADLVRDARPRCRIRSRGGRADGGGARLGCGADGLRARPRPSPRSRPSCRPRSWQTMQRRTRSSRAPHEPGHPRPRPGHVEHALHRVRPRSARARARPRSPSRARSLRPGSSSRIRPSSRARPRTRSPERSPMAASAWSDVAAVSIANQTETFVFWDRATGRPVHPAIVWQDRRTAVECDELAIAGHEPLVRARTGLELDATFPATKIRWVLDRVPGAAEAAEAGELAYGDVASWLVHTLCRGAVHVTEASNAGRTLLCGLGETTWDARSARAVRRACGAAAADRRLRLRVRLDGRARRRGSDRRRARRPAGVAVRAALLRRRTGEGHARHRAASCSSRPGRTTTATARWRARELRVEARGACRATRSKGSFRSRAPRSTGSSRSASSARPGRSMHSSPRPRGSDLDVVFVPALQGLGTPSWRADTRGTLMGLSRATSRADIARAAIDGVLHQIADGVDAIAAAQPIELILLDGGLSRSGYVVQRLADLTGVPIERAARADSTAMGAALLGGLRAGLWSTLAELPPTASDLRADPGLPDVIAATRPRPLGRGDRARRRVRAAAPRRVGSSQGSARAGRGSGRGSRHARHPRVHGRARRADARRPRGVGQRERGGLGEDLARRSREHRRGDERALGLLDRGGVELRARARLRLVRGGHLHAARSPTACRHRRRRRSSPAGRTSTAIPSSYSHRTAASCSRSPVPTRPSPTTR